MLLLSAYPPGRLSAQSPLDLSGRVVRVSGTDSIPVPNAVVVLHRIGQAAQGPVDSVRTDRAGRFVFRVARPDTLAIYTTSTEYSGIGYFGEPVQSGQPAPPQILGIYDTTSSGPPLTIGIRHVIIARPDAAGRRRVLDIVQVLNPGNQTRVGPDSLAAVWSGTVPPGLTEPEVGQSDVPPNTVTFADGRISTSAPMPPGAKQIAVSYVLEGRPRRFTIPVDQATERLELLVEDSTAAVPGLAPAEPIDLDGRAFRRFGLDSVAAGREIVVTFGASSTGRTMMWVAIAVAALGLLGGLSLALRKTAEGKAAEGSAAEGKTAERRSGKDALVAQIAALDERYDGRREQVDAEEWSAYEKKRATLKEQLAKQM